MAEYNITDIKVTKDTGTSKFQVGEAVPAGQASYMLQGKLMLATASDNTGVASAARYISITDTDAIDEYVMVATQGTVDIKLSSGTLPIGIDIILGITPGTLRPISDLAAGEMGSKIGQAISGTELVLDFVPAIVAASAAVCTP